MHLSFKTRFILYALFPLLLVTMAVVFLTREAHVLSQQELASFRKALLTAEKGSIKNYIRLAEAVIQPILDDANNSEQHAKEQIKQLLHQLKYDDNNNGYFFVYDQKGTNLVHPILKENEGKNLYHLKDCNGKNVIQDLLAVAERDGKFHRYCWNKPSTGKEQEKMSYVIKLDRWNWVLGTGFYIDDFTREVTIIEHQVKNNILYIVYSVMGVSIVLTILLGYMINWRVSTIANKRLRERVHRFISLQINERRCFSRELHDGINQLLVATKQRIALGILQTKRSQQTDTTALVHLKEAEAMLSEAIQDIRHISHNLRPSLLDSMGLKAALQSLLSDYQQRTGIDYRFVYPLEVKLADDLEITLYRVIQEALTNTEKHANAQQITLMLQQQGDAIALKISDDGEGFSLQQENKVTGIGLQNMCERVELVGGEFSVESSHNAGTQISVTLPKEIQ